MYLRVGTASPRAPRPEEQPQLPPEGPVHEVRQNRESRGDTARPKGERPLTPSEADQHGLQAERASKERPRWSKSSSGSFGGGGLGAH
ncbi:DUF6479 family protein [Streptomyces tricolor]|nr:DUF6479 family protein [Streptomyces tricolor]